MGNYKFFKRGAKMAAKQAEEELARAAEAIDAKMDSWDEREEEIIDLIEDLVAADDESVKSIFSKFREKREKRVKKFSIEIVYAHEGDKGLSENLRTSLLQQKNRATMNTFEDYKKVNNRPSEYVIMIKTPDELDGTTEVIYNKYGCKIEVVDNCYIMVDYRKPENINEIREELVDYYLQLVNNAEQNQRIIDDFEKTKKKSNAQNAEKLKDEADKLYKRFLGLGQTVLLQIVRGIAFVPVSVLYLVFNIVFAMPFGVSERIAEDLITAAQKNDFDNKSVAEIQRQILQIKLCRLISNQQVNRTSLNSSKKS